MVFTRYRKKDVTELRPYQPGESLFGISIRTVDRDAGHPAAGDMIARDPLDHAAQWLVPRLEFEETYEVIAPVDVESAYRYSKSWRPVGVGLALAPDLAQPVYPLVCNVCGRAAVAGERLGETCGVRLPVTFEAKDAAEMAYDLDRFRMGLPAEGMTGDLCYGVLVGP